MSSRRLRTTCLALAAWAVLFAPGRAAPSDRDHSAIPQPDTVAAAIVAPTFGSQAFAGREYSTDADQTVDTVAPADLAAPPLAAPVAELGLFLVPVVVRDRRPGRRRHGVPTGTRAPPASVPTR